LTDFAAVNTNSLNVSSGNKYQQKTKIYGIARMRADIIFLSDIRINETTGLSHKETIEHLFKFNPYKSYDCYFNSTRSARGVGILIATELEYNIENTRADRNENIIVMRINVGGHTCTVGAVYGPNSRDPEFFNELTNYITDLGSDRIILGGDWNCVPNVTPIQVNLDCLNMINLPNPGQSENLVRFMDRNNLCDVFRAKYPVLREFTYVPYGTVRKNRSRIDFVLVSQNLIPEVREAKISDTRIAKSFDHKPVTCNFKKKRFCGRRVLRTGSLILKDPETQLISKLCAIEAYINNIAPEEYGNERLNRARLTVGNCWNLLKLIGPNPTHLLNWLVTPEEVANRERILGEIDVIIQGFNLPLLEVMPLVCTPFELYVNLTMALKNELTSYQDFVWKSRNATKNRLKSKLNDYRIAGNVICEEFFRAEEELTNFVQYELEIEFEQSSYFDILSNEKPSKFLSTMLKGSKKTVSQQTIRDENGEEFPTPAARNAYIVNYFKKIYSKDEEDEISIEEFLGEDCINHDLVRESKLTEMERLELERPILIGELDVAVRDIRLNTAAGIDGVSNSEIKTFWGILRYPLFNTLNEALALSSLPAPFRQAGIKLIPKKGNTEDIENWRPISLLSCSYKIMS